MAVTWSFSKSTTRVSNPQIGECTMDTDTGRTYIWDGFKWAEIVDPRLVPPDPLVPTEEQLKKYPALKNAWEEYLIVRRVIGR